MHPLLRIGLTVLLLLSLTTLPACFPEKRLAWSGDAKCGAVLAGDGLRITTPEGTLSDVLVPNASDVAWLPDHKHIIVTRSVSVKSWQEATRHLTADQQAEVTRAANAVRGILQAGEDSPVELRATAEDFLKFRYRHLGEIPMLKLRETDEALLARKMGLIPAELPSSASLNLLERYRIEDGKAQKAGQLAAWPGISGVRVSPDGQYVLFIAGSRLMVGPSDGSKPATVRAASATTTADWSPDSRYIVYLKPLEAALEQGLATLTRQCVRDSDGNVVQPTEQSICGLIYWPFTQVRYLANGRLVFVTSELTLPWNATEMDPPSLFTIDVDEALAGEGGGKPVVVLAAKDSPDLPLVSLTVDPTGKRVAISDIEGKVGVFEFATSKLTIVQPGKAVFSGVGAPTMPAWRSADELAFVEVSAESSDLQLVLYSLITGKKTVLSKNWPDAATRGFLRVPTTQPDPNAPALRPQLPPAATQR